MKNSLSSKEIYFTLQQSSIFNSPSFSVRFVPRGCFKVGFSVSRRLGSAVVRNKFKRKIRALVFSCGLANLGFYLLFFPGRSLDNFRNIERDLKKLYKCLISEKEKLNG